LGWLGEPVRLTRAGRRDPVDPRRRPGGSAVGQRGGRVGGKPGQAVAAQVAVAHAEGLEEPLLPHRQADEVTQLDQLRLGEVAVQLGPQVIIGQPRVPGDRLGPPQRGLLPFGQQLRPAEIDDLVERALGQALGGTQVRARPAG
jgi:hypothetical protein